MECDGPRPNESTDDAALCWISSNLSYDHNASIERCPVRSCISISGAPRLKNSVAAVARKLWLVLWPPIPASEHMVFSFA